MNTWCAEAYELVRGDLAEIDRTLLAVADTDVEPLCTVCREVLASGGKRIRPALLALASRATGGSGYEPDGAVTLLGAAVEAVHVASLLHDDVVDGAALRRGRTTANAVWGDSISIFAADYLFAAVFAALASPANVALLRYLSHAVVRMCEAEVLQARSSHDSSVREECYLRIIEGKTAALMSAACRIGALLGGADGAVAEALATYGRSFGIAFQMTDDLLDLTGAASEVGKAPGADIRSGYFTLPLIRLRDGLSGPDLGKFHTVTSRGSDLSDDDMRWLTEAASAAGVIEECTGIAAAAAEQAIDALSPLAASPASEALAALARGLVHRRG